MPTVEVYNGNLEDALVLFKRKAQDEGIVKICKQQMAFTSPAEERNRKAYRAKCKRKERMERRGK